MKFKDECFTTNIVHVKIFYGTRESETLDIEVIICWRPSLITNDVYKDERDVTAENHLLSDMPQMTYG